jgi:hypothetical protein
VPGEPGFAQETIWRIVTPAATASPTARRAPPASAFTTIEPNLAGVRLANLEMVET